MNAPQAVTHPASEAPSTDVTPTAPGTSRTRDRFIVGVDGSSQSVDALRWAARIAAGTGARIEVITTWEPRLGMSGPFVASVDGTYLGPEDDAQALLSRVVDAAYGGGRAPNLTLTAREGDAAHILIEESKTAQLLVIGSRGLGEVAGLVLGSVSAHCAEKAQCPVLIMHEPNPS